MSGTTKKWSSFKLPNRRTFIVTNLGFVLVKANQDHKELGPNRVLDEELQVHISKMARHSPFDDIFLLAYGGGLTWDYTLYT